MEKKGARINGARFNISPQGRGHDKVMVKLEEIYRVAQTWTESI